MLFRSSKDIIQKTNLTSKKGISELLLFKNRKFEVKHISIKKGSIIAEQSLATDCLLYVLEGTCLIAVQGKEYTLTVNEHTSLDADTNLLIKAQTDTSLLLIK